MTTNEFDNSEHEKWVRLNLIREFNSSSRTLNSICLQIIKDGPMPLFIEYGWPAFKEIETKLTLDKSINYRATISFLDLDGATRTVEFSGSDPDNLQGGFEIIDEDSFLKEGQLRDRLSYIQQLRSGLCALRTNGVSVLTLDQHKATLEWTYSPSQGAGKYFSNALEFILSGGGPQIEVIAKSERSDEFDLGNKTAFQARRVIDSIEPTEKMVRGKIGEVYNELVDHLNS